MCACGPDLAPLWCQWSILPGMCGVADLSAFTLMTVKHIAWFGWCGRPLSFYLDVSEAHCLVFVVWQTSQSLPWCQWSIMSGTWGGPINYHNVKHFVWHTCGPDPNRLVWSTLPGTCGVRPDPFLPWRQWSIFPGTCAGPNLGFTSVTPTWYRRTVRLHGREAYSPITKQELYPRSS